MSTASYLKKFPTALSQPTRHMNDEEREVERTFCFAEKLVESYYKSRAVKMIGRDRN